MKNLILIGAGLVAVPLLIIFGGLSIGLLVFVGKTFEKIRNAVMGNSP